jgi:hypothetical protein
VEVNSSCPEGVRRTSFQGSLTFLLGIPFSAWDLEPIELYTMDIRNGAKRHVTLQQVQLEGPAEGSLILGSQGITA